MRDELTMKEPDCMTNQTNARATVGIPLAICLILAMVGLVLLGFAPERLPAPAGANAPASQFSSARALGLLAHIAAKPHPTGSPENAEVRTYLVGELAKLGLKAEIQSGIGRQSSRPWGVVGQVHNVVARLPGTGHPGHAGGHGGKALLLSAHYDSVPNSPGAADNGASVAAVLETVRALKTGPALRNDVIILFTDGEEAGLLGSDVFANSHPWANDVALALNFDFRGSGGPILMFETSGGNGKMIAALAQSAGNPVANSLLYEVYQLMPNDTDMTSYKARKMRGMNFAAIEQSHSYHMQTDRIDAVDPASLQQLGEILLSLTRHYGTEALAGGSVEAPNRVYFNLPGLGLVHYPASAAAVLAAATLALFIGVTVLAVRAGQARTGRVIGGAFAFLATAILLALAAQLLWMAIGVVYPEINLLDSPYHGQWYLLGFAALVAAAFTALLPRWGRWLSATEFGLGAMLFWVFLQVVAALAAPGATFLLTWSLLPLFGVLAFLFTRRGQLLAAAPRAALLLAGLAPALVLAAPVLRMVFSGLGPQLFFITGILLVLVLGIMTPLLSLLNHRSLVPLAGLATGVAAIAAGMVLGQFDDRQPQPSNLFYAYNGNSGQAFWISRDEELDKWNAKYFPKDVTPRKVPEIFGANPRLYWAGAAPVLAGLAAPQIEVLDDVTIGSMRSIAMRVRSARNAPALTVKVEGTPVTGAQVQGKEMTLEAGPRWVLEAYGLGGEWLELAVQVKTGKAFQVRLSDEVYGLPAAEAASRSAAIVPGMYGTSADTIRAVQVMEFK